VPRVIFFIFYFALGGQNCYSRKTYEAVL